MPSRPYCREYPDWLAKGNFQRVYEWGRQSLAEAIELQRPDLVVPALDRLALCYYKRGAARLMDREELGWHDVQCGYLASVYAFRFMAPLATGLAGQLKDSPKYITSTVMTLGLARLFSVAFDEHVLRDWLDVRYDVAALTDKVGSGRSILDSIYHRQHGITVDTLRQDRKECCRHRDAYPPRPTEFPPFGVLDVEMAISFPGEAEFPYPAIAYSPTEDDSVIQGITVYHQWTD